jgi:hypothetical protein
MAILRPNLSLNHPAWTFHKPDEFVPNANELTPAAPKKQPPAKVETIAPRILLDGLNVSRKGAIVMTEAMTPL